MLGTTALTITPLPAQAQGLNTAPASQPLGPDDQQGTMNGSALTADSCSAGSNGSNGVGSGKPCGAAAARDPTINSGCATPADVRQQQQLGGLVPPRQVRTCFE